MALSQAEIAAMRPWERYQYFMGQYANAAPKGGPIVAGHQQIVAPAAPESDPLAMAKSIAMRKMVSKLLADGGASAVTSSIGPLSAAGQAAAGTAAAEAAGIGAASELGVSSGMIEALGAQSAIPSLAAAPTAAAAPVATSAAGVPGSGLLTGAAAPLAGLAFVASAPLWAPKMAKAGKWFGKNVLGIGNERIPRTFNLDELANQRALGASPKGQFEQQLSGWKDASIEQRKSALQAFKDAATTRFGSVALPGGADDQGKTTSGQGFEHIMGPMRFARHGEGSQYKRLVGQYGKDFEKRMDLGKQSELYEGGAGMRIQPGVYNKYKEALAKAQGILAGAPAQVLPGVLPGIAPIVAANIDPGFNLKAAPIRKDSPGFKDGKRVNVGRR